MQDAKRKTERKKERNFYDYDNFFTWPQIKKKGNFFKNWKIVINGFIHLSSDMNIMKNYIAKIIPTCTGT